MTPYQPLEEAFSSSPFPPRLKEHVNNFAILINGPPQVMLLAVDFYEDFIDEEIIALSPVLSLQSAGIDSTELDTPESDRFSSDCNATLSQQIFDIAVAQVESVVEPDGVTDDVGRESVALVGIHRLILPISGG